MRACATWACTLRASSLPSPTSPPLVVIALAMVVFMFGYASGSADKAGALAATATLMKVSGMVFLIIMPITDFVTLAFMNQTTIEIAV